ncbi:MAG: DUF3048 domain-containing protein [Agathobacter sp.]|nr:DUF3048 domain-containing protein [Agathobacter sp.]
MKNKVFICFLVGGLMISCMTGCQKRKDNVKTEDSQAVEVETETTKAETDVKTPVDTHEGQEKSLLTGEWIDEDIASKRPVAVMVENTKMALPQYGLSNADIIYECPVEGGITRLMAIFQDYNNIKKIGNVRSCRHYFAYLAHDYDAIYFHAGASKYAYDGVLAENYIEDIDGITGVGGQYFFRDSNKKAPHNLYTASDMISESISNMKWDTEYSKDYDGVFKFAEDDTEENLTNGDDAKAIVMYYQNPKPWFEYNDETGLYDRFEFGNEQIDGNTNTQISVKNIIIQNCSSSIMDDVGRLDFKLFSSGTGKYISNGKCIDITWKRNSKDDVTHYYDKDKKEIVLNQGKTWIELVEDKYSSKNVIYSSKSEFQKKR